MAVCVQNFPHAIKPKVVGATIVLIHAGDNDIRLGSKAEEIYSSFTRYVELCHGIGARVIVSTELKLARMPPQRTAELVQYDRLLIANMGGADGVVDLDRDEHFRDMRYRDDPQWFREDGIHPADAGNRLMADMLVSGIRNLR